MIQRIQTVYLVVIFILTSLMLALPLATFFGDTQSISLTAFAIEAADGATIVSTKYMGILIVIAALVPFVSVFLYKNRWMQIRLCIVEVVLQVGLIAYLIYYIYRTNNSLEAFDLHSMSLALPDVFPVVSIILSILAYRGILKDEMLIKSLNRIR